MYCNFALLSEFCLSYTVSVTYVFSFSLFLSPAAHPSLEECSRSALGQFT